MGSIRGLRLLPANALICTGPVDHGDWSFRPFLGWIIRQRYHMVLSLLPPKPLHCLLEVGYGSGIFMPSLSDRCSELHGIDIHGYAKEVTDRLRGFQVSAHLVSGSVEAMPFQNDSFDAVIALSCLEFVADLEAACQELQRVLKPDGFLVIVTPGYSPLLDWGLTLLTGQSAQKDYGDRRQKLMPTLLRFFKVDKQRTFPRIGSSLLCLYKSLRLSPQAIGPDMTSHDQMFENQPGVVG